MKIESYAVPCDACKSRGYIDGILCEKCDGNKSIVIGPMERPGISPQLLKTALCLCVIVAVVALALWGVR